jgi:hypothetical protein
MSRIESAAIPGTGPLLLGNGVLLDTYAQRALATLLSLIVIRLEFTEILTQAIPPEDRTQLKETFLPPWHWRIWIARYPGENSEMHRCSHTGFQFVSIPTESPGPVKCNTQVTTLVIGQLYAHVFSSTVWRDFSGYEGINFRQIWPPSQYDINPRLLPEISDADIVLVGEALAREMPYVQPKA